MVNRTRKNRKRGGNPNANNTLVITHNHGFFSNCSVRLGEIITYFNKHKKLPRRVNSSQQFNLFKLNGKKNVNISSQIFEDSNKFPNIQYTHDIVLTKTDGEAQFIDYRQLNLEETIPFLHKYFSPSQEIKNTIKEIENKYIKTDYANICTVFYRGNDKSQETQIASYDEFINQAKIILEKNPEVQFLVQSDETEFIETFMKAFSNNSFYLKDYIRHMSKRQNVIFKVFKDRIDEYAKYFFAITIIMGKAKHIVFGSGNCSIWIVYYRENTDNVHQFLNGKWL